MTYNDDNQRNNRERREQAGGEPRADLDRERQQRREYDEARDPRDPNDPAVIRSHIESTRTQMSETIDHIQHRLSPDRLRHEAETAVREATIGRIEDMAYEAKYRARKARRGIVNTIKDNPVPAALVGLGLGWLMMSGPDKDEYDYYDYDYDYDYEYERPPRRYAGPRRNRAYGWEYERPRASYGYGEGDVERRYYEGDYESSHERDRMEEARRRASEVTDTARARAQDVQEQVRNQTDQMREQVQEQASHLRHEMEDGAAYLREQARHQTRRTRRGFNRMLEENPLAVGALAAAAGALIGFAVPETRQEDKWMGEYKERVMHQAKEQVQAKAGETVEKVQKVAQEAKEATKEAANEVQEGRSATEAAKDAAKRTKDEAEKQNLTGTAKG